MGDQTTLGKFRRVDEDYILAREETDGKTASRLCNSRKSRSSSSMHNSINGPNGLQNMFRFETTRQRSERRRSSRVQHQIGCLNSEKAELNHTEGLIPFESLAVDASDFTGVSLSQKHMHRTLKLLQPPPSSSSRSTEVCADMADQSSSESLITIRSTTGTSFNVMFLIRFSAVLAS